MHCAPIELLETVDVMEAEKELPSVSVMIILMSYLNPGVSPDNV